MTYEVMSLNDDGEQGKTAVYIADNAKQAMEKHLYYLTLSQKINVEIKKSKHGYILDLGNISYFVKQ